jgi:hypothetical protein
VLPQDVASPADPDSLRSLSDAGRDVPWLNGRDAIMATYRSEDGWRGKPRSRVFRALPTRLNGEIGFVAYRRESPGCSYKPLNLTVMSFDADGTRIAEQCAEAVWGSTYAPSMDATTLDRLVSTLRAALRRADPTAGLIVTRPGLGYQLADTA